MTNIDDAFVHRRKIVFQSLASGEKIEIEPTTVSEAIVGANLYLRELRERFQGLSFDVYTTLGQRNLSGFIGEVFTNVLAKKLEHFAPNPHADGRPDLLDVSSPAAKQHLEQDCFTEIGNGIVGPNRSFLAPFKYGGIEVKASIGDPQPGYKDLLFAEKGVREFDIYMPRIRFLRTINYWAHHQSCESLLGLYYDYDERKEGTPQIFAAMYSQLDANADWRKVSVGKEGSKKTSNTSLLAVGRQKMMAGSITVLEHPTYLSKLREIGLSID